jgi:hypothetical protein
VRKRRTVRDQEEAKTIAADARIQAKNDGVKSFDIRDDLRRDAKAAARLLEPLGASILDAARFYAKHLEQQRSSEKVSVALKEFLAAREKDELRPRYLKDLKIRLNRFARSFGERPLASIEVSEINDWLRAFKPFHRNSFRAHLSVLFSYAVERGWCLANPVGWRSFRTVLQHRAREWFPDLQPLETGPAVSAGVGFEVCDNPADRAPMAGFQGVAR